MARTSGLNEPSRLQRVLSVLGDVDSQILARARADTAEMTGRGIAALIPAVFGGLAALIPVGAENPVMATDLVSREETELAVWLREHLPFGQRQNS